MRDNADISFQLIKPLTKLGEAVKVALNTEKFALWTQNELKCAGNHEDVAA